MRGSFLKLLNLNDTHISGTNSIRRIGNMYEDFMLKLDETIELSKSCDMVIHSGDLFHTSLVANNIVDDVVDKIEAVKIPWFVLPGNHDCVGANWNVSQGTSLAHIFRRSKLIQGLNDIKGKDFYIKGYTYYHNIEQDFKDKGIFHDLKKSKKVYTIAVTHALISPKPFLQQVLHVEIKDIKTNYDVVLCSHLHQDSGEIKVGNTSFVNVGAWGRRTITEINNTPKVTIIDTDTREIKIVPLQSAKKGNLIFDINKKEQEEISNIGLENFISSLKDFKANSLDLRGTVEQISKEQKIERPIVDLIFSKITELEKNELKN